MRAVYAQSFKQIKKSKAEFFTTPRETYQLQPGPHMVKSIPADIRLVIA